MSHVVSPEMAALHAEWVSPNSEGKPIPNMFLQHVMPDEAHLDLIGSVRIRKHQPKDGSPPMSAPVGMQIWVEIDLRDAEVIRWWYVDARIVFMAQNWFQLNEILLLAPSHWPLALKNQYPNAIPSVCLYSV